MLTCVELITCADRILELGVQEGTCPAARFAPVKVRVRNPHCPTQYVTGLLTDVSWIAVEVTVIVTGEVVTLPPDPVAVTE
jgi:hypothetical protein